MEDTNKIENLYRQEKDNFVKTMYRITRNFHLAEDIVQEAFTRAIYFLPSYKEERGTLRTWFNGILYNTLHDFQKDERNSGMKSDTVDITVSDIWASYALMEREEYRNKLLRAIEKYSKRQKHRDVLELFYILGYSSREISQAIPGITPTNVTTIAKRFRDFMLKDK